MSEYDFREIEERWRKRWEETRHDETDHVSDRPRCYCLSMYSYPSGDRLHLGHWYNYVPADTWARFKRMRGFNVFQPVGFDSFGLPAENYAIKCGVHPGVHTAENIRIIREQLKTLGPMYDWRSELATHTPEYYKWTQWLFLTLYRNGLAYRAAMPVNWCPSCQTVLANEQVVDGACERDGAEVERRNLTQWCFRITRYADRLIDNLASLDWPEETKKKQINWIGRSHGAEVVFTVPAGTVDGALPAGTETDAAGGALLRVFTTRPDTLYGVTYMALAPEHPLVAALTDEAHRSGVSDYRRKAQRLSEVDRQSTDRPKTGVHTGAVAVNPVNGERVPVLVADYVLATYGTGAVMAVPAHDERDFAFAAELGLPVRRVILAPGGDPEAPLEAAYTEPGSMLNSGEHDGMDSVEGGRRIVESLAARGLGAATIQYRLRDWIISRQRYWGAPIPIVHCAHCGEVPVPDEQLPVLLPEVAEYRPRGKSPLAACASYMNTRCPQCGEPARRDPDTMDTFVCSSWYFLRYLEPGLDTAPFRRETLAKWFPIEMYVGGADHAYGHLIYARFINMVLYDLGLVPSEEPFRSLRHQGMITRNGEKMSKSKGNTVVPADYLANYGTDTLRTYLMFGFAFAEGGDWTDDGIDGVWRYLNRVWRLIDAAQDGHSPAGDAPADAVPLAPDDTRRRWPRLRRVMHNSIKGCTQDIERFQFNTALSRLMELTNALYHYAGRDIVDLGDANFREGLEVLVRMLAPFAPHLGAELWERLGGGTSVFDATWPQWREEYLIADSITYVIQINGKIRERMEASRDAERGQLEREALSHGRIPELIGDKTVRKVIVIPNKLVNIVV
ncbi:leucine--tRNA ligase [bacterium]|nr:leucine--tRNA ligase [bacterium]MBU1073986.1 leucine--tRNA ligase [bacterium]MBU1676371.1 leucine--tRNA ligase [bacterium]